ncbi:MAG: HAMP domain-containing histidine kinase [Desulfohalobiaceae bacterium]|nr:HAMP domain-containing histidine kinase [Desulfohalobiaceae bacterium]MCF8106429.1 HAMP domain-containing histidine kinase [Desulfohalobiaceae bacterium]
MKQGRSFVYHMLIFIFAQLAWLILLGLWIYWYVTNYMFITEVETDFASQAMSRGHTILILIGGLILLLAVSAGMSLLFHRLSIQFNLTQLYDNFIANVTHELKSPLATIQLSLETLKKHQLSREQQERFIDMMLNDSKRLEKLINIILEIPALEKKKIAHHFEVFEIEPLLQELVQQAREEFKLPQDAIRVSGKASCRCVLDREAFKVVLDNLIDNSLKYSEGRPDIEINLSCDDKEFVLTYSDQGIGIPLKEQKNVFRKFYRANAQRDPSVKGTGLGLYWVWEILRFHRGRISLSNQNQDGGAVFVIRLPVYTETRQRFFKGLLKKAQKGPPPGEKDHV